MQTAAKDVSAKQVAIDLLRAADGPLEPKEIAKWVIDSGRCSGLKGKTPEATISAMLAVGAKTGGPFKRVGKGCRGCLGPPGDAPGPWLSLICAPRGGLEVRGPAARGAGPRGFR